MLRFVGHPHQVDDVDDTDLQLWELVPKDRSGGEGLEGWNVTRAPENHVGKISVVVARPFKDPESPCAVIDRLVHRQVCQSGLLTGHYEVDVIAAPKTMVGD